MKIDTIKAWLRNRDEEVNLIASADPDGNVVFLAVDGLPIPRDNYKDKDTVIL